MTQDQDETVRESQPIDTTGVILKEEVRGDKLVSINIEATAVTDFAIDVKAEGSEWFEGAATYSGSSIADTFRLGDRYVRVRVATAAATDETADVTLQEAR